MRRLWMVGALMAALAPPGLARAQEAISIPSFTPTGLVAFFKHEGPVQNVTGELYLPSGQSGPLPVTILKHGSGGLGGAGGFNIRSWAAILNGWGVAALTVDSFGPRDLKETATNQAALSSWADVADSLAALRPLGADPRFDRSRIGIVGWSRGGTVAIETAQDSVRRVVIKDDLKFALHVVFYGPGIVQYRSDATDKSPMLFLHGAADNYVPIAPTREYADWFASMGNPVSFVSYPGAYHDFDVVNGWSGFFKSGEIYGNCDLVVDLSTGRILRMDHKDNPPVLADDVPPYFRACKHLGAVLMPDASARADAIQRVHAFLAQYFHIPD
jgi:dienelactone hydrolase